MIHDLVVQETEERDRRRQLRGENGGCNAFGHISKLVDGVYQLYGIGGVEVIRDFSIECPEEGRRCTGIIARVASLSSQSY